MRHSPTPVNFRNLEASAKLTNLIFVSMREKTSANPNSSPKVSFKTNTSSTICYVNSFMVVLRQFSQQNMAKFVFFPRDSCEAA